jgi:LuxR family maltose regulon positive regulatory protein
MVMEKGEDVEEVASKLEGNLTAISAYLISEVLSKQSEEIRDAMLVSSILNRFNTDILDDIYLENRDLTGSQLIEYLHRFNMFIIDLDVEKKWFRYHHLFQELLRDLLNKQYTRAEIAQLHLTASQWFEENNFLLESMNHAIKCDNLDIAPGIIKRNRLELLNNNNYYLLEQLHNKISLSVVESDPELLLTEFYLNLHQGDFARLGELEEMMNSLIDMTDKESLVVIEFLFFVGFNSMFIREDLESALKYFDEAMDLVPESLAEQRGLLEMHYMIFGQFAGLYEKLYSMFYDMKDKDLSPIRKNRLFQGFACACFNEGKMDEAEKVAKAGIKMAEKTNMKNAHGSCLYLYGSYKLKIGEYNEVLPILTQVLENRYYVHSHVIIDSMICALKAYCLSHQVKEAKDTLSILVNHLEAMDEFSFPLLWSGKVVYHMLMGNHEMVKELIPEYKSGILDPNLWDNVPEIIHAQALIFEGSSESLKQAGQELEILENITTALSNKIHLYQIKVLQAIIFNLNGNVKKAEEALLASLDITMTEGIISYYIELGEMFRTLVKNMPEKIRSMPFIITILDRISKSQVSGIEEKHVAKDENPNILTPSELEVLELLTKGLRNKEIADELVVSLDTVKKHMYHMFQKLNVKNRLSLVQRAKEEGILVDEAS